MASRTFAIIGRRAVLGDGGRTHGTGRANISEQRSLAAARAERGMTAMTIDFLHPQRTPWLGWCLLVLGAGALIVAIWTEHQWSGQRAQHEAVQREREDAVRQARDAALRPVAPTMQERRFRQVAPQLRQPWLPTLRLIENVTEPPVYLLAMTVNPVTGELRLDGEAPGFAEALAYGRALDDEALMGPARLASHDTVANATGQQVVRFSIATRWITK